MDDRDGRWDVSSLMGTGAKLGHDALLASLQGLGAGEARVAIVLGSGLGPLADAVESARAVPYEELEGMPLSAVPGHAGRPTPFLPISDPFNGALKRPTQKANS